MHFFMKKTVKPRNGVLHVSVRNSVVLVSTKAMSHDTLPLPSSRSVVCGFVCSAVVKGM
jgi:hypothetical protein